MNHIFEFYQKTSFCDRMRRTTRTWLFVIMVVASATPLSILRAQGMGGISLSDAEFEADEEHPVKFTDTGAVIDPETRSVTLRLRNPSEDTTAVELALQFASPNRRLILRAEELLNPSSDTSRAPNVDSLESRQSLEHWIQEPLPTRLWLKPLQTVTLTFNIVVPDSIPPGEYSVYVVARQLLIARQKIGFNFRGARGSGVAYHFITGSADTFPPSAVKLTYTVGSQIRQ